jgi:hypothetical protein
MASTETTFLSVGDKFIRVWTLKGRDLVAGMFNLFCYICSILLFVWLFFFTYALLAVVYVSHVEDRFFNTPRL